MAQGNKDSNGVGDFFYAPPTGFLALCADNLPDVAVTPSEHFNTVLNILACFECILQKKGKK